MRYFISFVTCLAMLSTVIAVPLQMKGYGSNSTVISTPSVATPVNGSTDLGASGDKTPSAVSSPLGLHEPSLRKHVFEVFSRPGVAPEAIEAALHPQGSAYGALYVQNQEAEIKGIEKRSASNMVSNIVIDEDLEVNSSDLASPFINLSKREAANGKSGKKNKKVKIKSMPKPAKIDKKIKYNKKNPWWKRPFAPKGAVQPTPPYEERQNRTKLKLPSAEEVALETKAHLWNSKNSTEDMKSDFEVYKELFEKKVDVLNAEPKIVVEKDVDAAVDGEGEAESN